MRYKFVILFFLSVLLCRATMSEPRFNFESLMLDDGLSNLLVNVFYEDHDGFMWFGTDNSVDRYDGDKFVHYAFVDGVPDLLRVNAMTEFEGKYLVANKQGLWKINMFTRLIERSLADRIDCAVHCMLVDTISNTLYLGTDKGLYILSDGKVKNILKEPNALAQSNIVLSIGRDIDGLLWLVTGTGLSSFNVMTQTFSDYPAPSRFASGEHSMASLVVLGDTVYMGTKRGGILCYDRAKGIFSQGPDVSCSVVTSISSNGKNRVYVSTDGNGVHLIAHPEGTIVSSIVHNPLDPGSIRSNATYSVYVDEEDDMIWVGSYQDGVNYTPYKNDFLQVYRLGDKFSTQGMQVRSFCFRGNEKLIGTRNGLYYIDESTGDVRWYGLDEMLGIMVFDIYFYRGEYYIGTYSGGVSVLNPHTKTMRKLSIAGVPDGMTENKDIFCFREDADGILWMGTSEGIVRYDGKNNRGDYYTSANSALPQGNVMDILFDSTGKGWIATDKGLCIYDPSRRRLLTDVFPDGFGSKERIRVIYESLDGQIYFLPDMGSLCRCNRDMSGFERLPLHPLLKGKGFLSIAQTPDSILWLCSDDGLLSYDLHDMSSKLYARESGLPGTVFTYATARVIDDVLWMGNTHGLIYLDRRKREGSDTLDVKKNVINRVYVNGKEVSPDNFGYSNDVPFLRVDENKGNITFSFVQLSFADQKSMTYEYMLDGYDDEWHYQRGTKEIAYYRLPVGSYVFRVRTPGIATSEASLEVEVTRSYNVFTIVLLFLLLSAACFIVFYVRRMKTRLGGVLEAVRTNRRLQYARTEQERLMAENKYKSVNISPEECKSLHKKLTAHLKKSRCFTNPDLKLSDLAADLDVSSYVLSYLFSQYLQCSYYDFVNNYRVEEFKNAVMAGACKKYTLSALAERCGFSSRASFFRSFKKVTGETPNEYIKRQENG